MDQQQDTDIVKIQSDNLKAFAERLLLKAGFDNFSASTTAEGLVLSSLRGVDSHGIQLLPHYVNAALSGRLNKNPDIKFTQTSVTTGTIDADHALGFPAGQKAIDHCIAMAKENGMGGVSVFNSSHGGMLAYYVLKAAKQGMFAFAVTNTTPRMIPPGSKKAFLGTNPFCYAAPLQNEEPLCYDAATTQITGNKIQLYRKLGKELPDGVAADVEGNITTNAAIAEYLVPFGGYKGFGIALLVDILCGALTGMPNSESVTAMYGKDISGKRKLGQFFMVFSIEKFRSVAEFVSDLQDEVNRLRGLPNSGAERTLAPGDIEKEYYAERLAHGIPLNRAIYDSLIKAAVKIELEHIGI